MNKKALVVLIIFLTGSLFLTKTVLAAWTQAKGHAYNQLTWSYYVTKKKFTTLKADYDNVTDAIGGGVRRLETAKFTAESFTYYVEYGITDTLTVFTAIPWKWTRSEDTVKYSGERGPSGIGDIDFGLRYNLSKNLFGAGVLMSFQGAVKIPNAYDYNNPLEDLSLGDGQYDATLALLFGKGIGKGYALFNVGYKCRFENENSYYFKNVGQDVAISFKPSDQIKVFIGGGYAILPKLSLRGSIDWTKSVGNASVSEELIVANYFYTGQRWHKDDVLIRDTLGLEPDALNVGVALAFSITPKVQTVLSYNTDLEGIDLFETKDYALGETFSLALVYMY